MTYYAHSCNQLGQRHGLVEHLVAVAERGKEFAGKFEAGDLAYWVGLWHDAGKFHQAFQDYLTACEAAPRRKHRGPDHKRAGAALSAKHLPPLALTVQGHHGGLLARQQFKAWLSEPAYQQAIQEAIANAQASLSGKLHPAIPLGWPDWARDAGPAEMLTRFIFSALVDADGLDTERHFQPDLASARGGSPGLAELWDRLMADQTERFGNADDSPVNRVRRQVFEDCVAAAVQAPGFFRLTVPTGGGKTRSGLAFAIRHVLHHELDRIIFAIPYTSIIDQTAQVYREIFRDDRAVLEHHSAVAWHEADDEAPVAAAQAWRRLSAENWDAPVVVTTNVQFFESLLGQRVGKCRKLHNIARSVIVLDEAQTLPPHLIEPTLDVLRDLVAHYRVSVVLCTATQPALDQAPGFNGLPDVREICRGPERHFTALQRVAYQWPGRTEGWSWGQVADELRKVPSAQALAVVNTKANALALLDALGDAEALHLSTLLCGAHRGVVLAEVKRRLAAGEPCLLVSTQVVEAGVDLDFPAVFRALGPLDRIVQAAGRCNREGRLPEKGNVVVFRPEEGGVPPGAYRLGTDTTTVLLNEVTDLDLHDPAVFVEYFHRYYRGVDLDKNQVQTHRRSFDYPEVARRYRFIEDDGVPVVVKYDVPAFAEPERLLRALRDNPERGRAILRQLQPFIVEVRPRQLESYVSRGLAAEVMPGLWEWFGKYDPIRGLGTGEPDLVQLVVTE